VPAPAYERRAPAPCALFRASGDPHGSYPLTVSPGTNTPRPRRQNPHWPPKITPRSRALVSPENLGTTNATAVHFETLVALPGAASVIFAGAFCSIPARESFQNRGALRAQDPRQYRARCLSRPAPTLTPLPLAPSGPQAVPLIVTYRSRVALGLVPTRPCKCSCSVHCSLNWPLARYL
jgi:hypothetical protein